MRRTNKLLRSLKGWGFHMGALSKSEGVRGRASLSTEGDARISDKVLNQNLPYNDEYSVSPNGNICQYSGLLSVDNYMEE